MRVYLVHIQRPAPPPPYAVCVTLPPGGVRRGPPMITPGPFCLGPTVADGQDKLQGRSWGGDGERHGDEGTETRTGAGRLVPYHASDTSPE
ncbi:unnamed protein product [Lota lota]